MITLVTDSNNDLYLDGLNGISTGESLLAIKQVCENAVKTVTGELVLQGSVGIPYFQIVWSGAPKIPQIQSAIRETLTNVTGVTDVTELTAFVENNKLVYTATIKTIYGEVSIGSV